MLGAWNTQTTTVPLALAALIAIVVRIEAEERVLASDPAHARYREHVRWRLVPFVY